MGVEAYRKKDTRKSINDRMAELNEILNNSWDGIAILNDDGSFIFTNKAFSPILNYTKEELLRLSFINLTTEEYRELLRFAFVKTKKVGSVKNIKIVCQRKDKQLVYLECSLSLMQNQKYFVLNAKDYTEEVAKDEVINQYVLSVKINMENKITDVSDALCKLMKYKKDELIGRFYSKIRDIKLDKTKFDILLKEVNTKGSWTGVIKNHDKQKDIFYLDTKIKPIHNKYGDIVGYILISFDITDKIKLNEVNEKLKKQLSLTKDNVKEQQKQIDLLTTVASHWLEPLDTIKQNIQGIKKSNYDEQNIKNLISKIENESISLAKDISLFKDKYKKKQEKEDIDIKKILERIIKMLEDNNSQHKVVIHRTLEDVPTIYTYKNELTESIFALITNSLEAFKRKKVEKPILDIGLYLKDRKLVIQIIDNGGGIEDEIMKDIFNAYFSTKTQRGKGMGLYITKSFIEFDLEGKLFIENSDPIGYTTATIEIPLD